MKISKQDLESKSDEEILFLSKQYPDAFEVLVERHEAAFLRKAASIVSVPEDAQEIVQDTFTRMYVYADSFKKMEGARLTSWAYTILTRLAFTRYQKMKKQRTAFVEMESETFERLPEEPMFVHELTVKSEVLVALSRLPETFARVLRLQFIEGKSQETIAKEEGVSVGALKTRVHRAKKLFKKALEETNTPNV
jgi:RNA polymerase sigma-70 factor (ECF subfamily)